MNAQLTISLGRLFSAYSQNPLQLPVFEHVAEHSPHGLNLIDKVNELRSQGYEILKGNSPAFVQKDLESGSIHRLEIIPPETPTHVAYAVESSNRWKTLDEIFGKRSDEFEQNTNFRSMTHDLFVAMYKHRATGEHVQIIWRAKQLFRGVFPE